MNANHVLYRKWRPDGSTEDQFVPETFGSELIVFHGETGSKRYRRTVTPASLMKNGAEAERTSLVERLVASGYKHQGIAVLDEKGAVLSWPDPTQANVDSLAWNFKPRSALTPGDVRKAFAEVVNTIGEEPVLGFSISGSIAWDEYKIVSPHVKEPLTITLGGKRSSIRLDAMRGAGIVEPAFMPFMTLVLMALQDRLRAFEFVNAGGQEVKLTFHRTNAWLIPDTVPLSRQRPLAAKLGLCAAPIDLSKFRSTGVDV